MMFDHGLENLSLVVLCGISFCRTHSVYLGFHVSVCVDWILPTFADRCGTLQCLLRIVGFGYPLGVADHLLSRPGDDTRCLDRAGPGFLFSSVRFCDPKQLMLRLLGLTHSQSRASSWDSSGGEKISRSGLCFCESSGFRGDSWVRESQSAKHGMNANMVPSSGFGGAAGFAVLKWSVKE